MNGAGKILSKSQMRNKIPIGKFLQPYPSLPLLPLYPYKYPRRILRASYYRVINHYTAIFYRLLYRVRGKRGKVIEKQKVLGVRLRGKEG